MIVIAASPKTRSSATRSTPKAVAASPNENLTRLDLVRALLLNPTKQSMQECQDHLAVVTSALSKRSGDSAFLAEVRTALQPIRFLLNKAAAFWAARQLAAQPSQTYTPEGRLLTPPSTGTLSLEV